MQVMLQFYMFMPIRFILIDDIYICKSSKYINILFSFAYVAMCLPFVLVEGII